MAVCLNKGQTYGPNVDWGHSSRLSDDQCGVAQAGGRACRSIKRCRGSFGGALKARLRTWALISGHTDANTRVIQNGHSSLDLIFCSRHRGICTVVLFATVVLDIDLLSPDVVVTSHTTPAHIGSTRPAVVICSFSGVLMPALVLPWLGFRV